MSSEQRCAPRAMESAGSVLRRATGEFVVSKQKLRQAEAVQLVRANREAGTQSLGFASRPFVLCGLPVKRPQAGTLLHERRNGQFVLQVTGHPSYGLPWGDKTGSSRFASPPSRFEGKVPGVTFESAAEMLDILACTRVVHSIGS